MYPKNKSIYINGIDSYWNYASINWPASNIIKKMLPRNGNKRLHSEYFIIVNAMIASHTTVA